MVNNGYICDNREVWNTSGRSNGLWVFHMEAKQVHPRYPDGGARGEL